jgi:hypothetical protein
MGWGTEFTTNIFINKTVFRSLLELNTEIENINIDNSNYKKELAMLVAATPRDIVPDEWKDEPITWLGNRVDYLIESIIENELLLKKINLFKEHLEDSGKDIQEYNPFKDE